MKSVVYGFVGMIAVGGIALCGYARLGLLEVRADANPPAWERTLAQFAVHASVTRSAAGLRNPLQPTPEILIAGGKLYMNGCAGCHGEPGKPQSTTGYPPPPQFAQVGTQFAEPELFWIVKHGIRRTGMSAYGPFFSDEKMWSLAAFVKRMNNLSPAVLAGIQTKHP